jgi:DUF4097 and DUF4098 domain-containing protein YvlB
MRTGWHKSVRVLASAVLLAACVSVALAADGSFQRTLAVSGRVDLEAATGSGDIRVRTGAAGSVQVVGHIRARDDFRATADEKIRFLTANPPIEQSGNVVRIGRIEDAKYKNNVSISYEIVTPSDTRLTAHTGSGNISAEGVLAPTEATTGSGDIKISGVGAEVRARTGSGNVEVDGAQGAAELSTGSGDIRAGRLAGALRARTGSGDIRADFAKPGDADASTGSGIIELNGVKGSLTARTGSGDIRVGGEPTAAWVVHSSSGDVTLRLSGSAAFDLDAHASSGDITLNHPVTVSGTLSRKTVKGKIRGGGAMMEVRAGSGNIRIE